jgi:RNA recognition motif-containing protein
LIDGKKERKPLYVSQIPLEAEPGEIRKFFGTYGDIIKFKHLKNENFATSIAFVTFKNPEVSNKLINMKILNFKQGIINVDPAKP